MQRRAVWRPRPDDPKTVVGWIRQNGWPRSISWQVAFLYTFAVLCLSAAVGPWGLLFLLVIAGNLGSARRFRRDLTPLSTVPSPGPAFACLMTVEQGSENIVVGRDEGIVTFVGGWLHFAGTRTEFSFRAKDVKGFGGSSVYAGPTKNPRFRLGETLVQLEVRDPHQDKELMDTSRHWYETSTAEGDGPIMPPQTVDRVEVVKAGFDSVRSIVNGLAIVVFITLLLREASVNGSAFVMISSGFVGTRNLQRLMALKKLRRQDLQALSNVSKPVIGP